MATTSTSTRSVAAVDSTARRTVSLADRIALRAGLALIVWSRRTHRGPRLPDARLAWRAARDEEQRRAAWERDAAHLARFR